MLYKKMILLQILGNACCLHHESSKFLDQKLRKRWILENQIITIWILGILRLSQIMSKHLKLFISTWILKHPRYSKNGWLSGGWRTKSIREKHVFQHVHPLKKKQLFGVPGWATETKNELVLSIESWLWKIPGSLYSKWFVKKSSPYNWAAFHPQQKP